jgi:hypothetical protein
MSSFGNDFQTPPFGDDDQASSTFKSFTTIVAGAFPVQHYTDSLNLIKNKN